MPRKHDSMDIYLDRRAVRQIRLSAQEAIEEGDTESLREDILEALTEEQVEEIERRLDNGDFFEFLTDILDEWSGDDTDELFELLETQIDRKKFEALKDRYYELCGWSREKGWPTRETLEKLDMADIADGLESDGLLG